MDQLKDSKKALGEEVARLRRELEEANNRISKNEESEAKLLADLEDKANENKVQESADDLNVQHPVTCTQSKFCT